MGGLVAHAFRVQGIAFLSRAGWYSISSCCDFGYVSFPEITIKIWSNDRWPPATRNAIPHAWSPSEPGNYDGLIGNMIPIGRPPGSRDASRVTWSTASALMLLGGCMWWRALARRGRLGWWLSSVTENAVERGGGVGSTGCRSPPHPCQRKDHQTTRAPGVDKGRGTPVTE